MSEDSELLRIIHSCFNAMEVKRDKFGTCFEGLEVKRSEPVQSGNLPFLQSIIFGNSHSHK